jgi:hypothetical protein
VVMLATSRSTPNRRRPRDTREKFASCLTAYQSRLEKLRDALWGRICSECRDGGRHRDASPWSDCQMSIATTTRPSWPGEEPDKSACSASPWRSPVMVRVRKRLDFGSFQYSYR